MPAAVALGVRVLDRVAGDPARRRAPQQPRRPRARASHHRPARRRHARLLRPAPATRSSSSPATRSSPTPCTRACAWCRPTRSVRRGERDAVWAAFRRSPTSTAGRWPSWAPARSGCRSTGPSGMHELYVGDEAVVDVHALQSRRRTQQGPAPGRQPHRQVRLHRSTFHDPAHLDAGARRHGSTADDREPARRGRARLLDDARPHLRPRRQGPAARRVLRRPTASPSPSASTCPRPASTATRSTSCGATTASTRTACSTSSSCETHPAPARRRLRAGSASTSPPCAPCWPARPGAGLTQRIERWVARAHVGLDADRVALEVQRQVRPRVAAALRRVRHRRQHVPVAFAVARAESFWELPLLGRFLMPGRDDPTLLDGRRFPKLCDFDGKTLAKSHKFGRVSARSGRGGRR